MLAVGGQHGKPVNSLFSVKEIVAERDDRHRHRAGPHHPRRRARADRRAQPRATRCAWTTRRTATARPAHACLDEENAQFTVLTPTSRPAAILRPSAATASRALLPDGRILVSWADGPVNDLHEQSLTPPDFGIYIYDPPAGKNQLVYNDRTTWELNALAVAPRAEPPVIGNVQHAQDSTHAGAHRLGRRDADEPQRDGRRRAVQRTRRSAQALKQGAVAVRVIEGFSSEAAKGVTMFGLTMHEGAAVLGEAPVYSDGSWLANIPPYLPVHLQPIDKFGLAIRNQRLWIQGMPGEDRRCVGCHESRTGQGVPRFGQNPTVAEQHGAAAVFIRGHRRSRTEYPVGQDRCSRPRREVRELPQRRRRRRTTT